MKEHVTCIIEHKKPIDVIVFTKGLACLSKMYARRKDNASNTQLLISEVRKGSICVDIIAEVTATLFNSIHPVMLTFQDLKGIYAYLLNPEKNKRPSNVSLPDFSDAKDIANISSNEGTTTTFKDSKNNIIIQNSYKDCTIINDNYDNLIRPDINPEFHSKQLFSWNQTNFDKDNTGNKGTIRAISHKVKQVIFDNQYIKEKMTSGINWQKIDYIVDVYAQENHEGIIKSYKIVKLHERLTED